MINQSGFEAKPRDWCQARDDVLHFFPHLHKPIRIEYFSVCPRQFARLVVYALANHTELPKVYSSFLSTCCASFRCRYEPYVGRVFVYILEKEVIILKETWQRKQKQKYARANNL